MKPSHEEMDADELKSRIAIVIEIKRRQGLIFDHTSQPDERTVEFYNQGKRVLAHHIVGMNPTRAPRPRKAATKRKSK